MSDTPEIIESAAQPCAVIRFTIPRAEIQKVMGPAHAELLSVVKAQDIGPAGPWFSHHFRTDPAVFDFEIGVPVTGPVTPIGRVIAGELRATRLARTIYVGPHEGLGAAWSKFDKWVQDNGHTPADDFWEVYVAGPESGEDSSTFRTELNRPLAD